MHPQIFCDVLFGNFSHISVFDRSMISVIHKRYLRDLKGHFSSGRTTLPTWHRPKESASVRCSEFRGGLCGRPCASDMWSKGKTIWDVYAYTKANCIFSVQPLLTTWIQNSGFCGTYCSHTTFDAFFVWDSFSGVWRVKSTRALKGLSLWGHCLFGFPSLLHGPTRVGTALLPSDAAEWGGQRSFLVLEVFRQGGCFFVGA